MHRCLEKNSEQRFHSAHDLAFALETLTDSAITTPSGSHPAASGGWTRRQKLFAGITAISVLALGGLAFLLLRPEPAPKVSNYVQLTRDGNYKFLVGDGRFAPLLCGGEPGVPGYGRDVHLGRGAKKAPKFRANWLLPGSAIAGWLAVLAVEEQAGVGNGQIGSFPTVGRLAT